MQVTDTIADMLTRIRNAQCCQARHRGGARLQHEEGHCQILVDEGYVKSFSVIEDGKQGMITHHPEVRRASSPSSRGCKRVSKPGLRDLFQRAGPAQGHEGPGRGHHLHFQGRS